jgi:DNA-binding CsgD family transcriptional regulator
MSNSKGLPESDVRELVRLLADVAIVEGGIAAKKHALMSGLSKLVDANGWLWSLTKVEMETKTPISVGLLHDGLTPEQLTGWLEASQSTTPPPEDAPLCVLYSEGKHYTRRRQQVVTDAEWYNHPAVKRHRLQVGLDHFLYSVYPLEDREYCSAIGMFRHHGRDAFSERDTRLAHIVLSEVEWLHYAELPSDRGRKVPELNPRQRVVLMMLLDTHNKDEIASLLHISPHTVKDHMKAIYKTFNVSSQLELIRRFQFGDEGDVTQEVRG